RQNAGAPAKTVDIPSFGNAKIRISRVQKQIYLRFAEAKYLRRSQRYEKADVIMNVCFQKFPGASCLLQR
ncbi:hypothetical protein, partial [Alistipes putredinis]|uniref:hypothetical protein n=1 Tax=Alistipes putredinis TaxID=28117 RepID=UPI003AF1119D